MNNKLFFSCLMITFGMLFWLVLQPGSLIFIAVRAIIAFISIVMVFFSVTWNQKSKRKQTTLILLFILAFGSVAYFLFNWGLAHHPLRTVGICIVLVVVILLYIKYVEPKIFGKPKKPKGDNISLN